jgi:tetrapyrrole methylase family protein/MazG family protein
MKSRSPTRARPPATSLRTGTLTIVGLGPARSDHLTREALNCLEGAVARGVRAYGLAHVREIVATVAPDLQVRPLDYLYQLQGVDRPTAYRDLASMLVRRAFDDGQDVLYLVAGSPLYINDAVLGIRHRCAQQGHPLHLIHGISFVDLVLDRVYWTGHVGLQLYSAWNVARDGVVLSPDAPALLCQLGEFSAGGEALNTTGSQGMLTELRDRLLESHPEDHPVIVLFSSGHPDYRSLARATSLGALASEPVPVYSNLWVPSLNGPPIEREVAPASDSTP